MDSKFKDILGQILVEKVETFSNFLNGNAIGELKAVRKEALDFLKTKGFPDKKYEAYKYTDISKEIVQNFDLSLESKSPQLTTEQIKKLFNAQPKFRSKGNWASEAI